MKNMLAEELTPELDTLADVWGLRNSNHALKTFAEMWYHIFLWGIFSSVFVHTCAALVAFVTLRKHKFGRFFSILIVVMGIVSPATSGIVSASMKKVIVFSVDSFVCFAFQVSSAVIAFVHRASSLQMSPVSALVWGVGQTVLSAFIGYTRILATL